MSDLDLILLNIVSHWPVYIYWVHDKYDKQYGNSQ